MPKPNITITQQGFLTTQEPEEPNLAAVIVGPAYIFNDKELEEDTKVFLVNAGLDIAQLLIDKYRPFGLGASALQL